MDHKEREGKANVAPARGYIRRVFSNMQGLRRAETRPRGKLRIIPVGHRRRLIGGLPAGLLCSPLLAMANWRTCKQAAVNLRVVFRVSTGEAVRGCRTSLTRLLAARREIAIDPGAPLRSVGNSPSQRTQLNVTAWRHSGFVFKDFSPTAALRGFPASEALKICTRLLLRSQT